MIYDCFILYNELDLLELRLRELEGVVDRFVLVEAPVTFSGVPKPLLCHENRRRFSKWRSKIRHVVVNDMPTGKDPWAHENHQRSAIVRGIPDASPSDGIILSDGDEIPSAVAVRSWAPEMSPRRFEQICLLLA